MKYKRSNLKSKEGKEAQRLNVILLHLLIGQSSHQIFPERVLILNLFSIIILK